MDLSLKAKSRTANVIVQQIDGEVLIYDTDSNRAVALNDTASTVWNLLDGESSVSDIAERSQLPADLVLLSIDELQNKGLLHEKVETGIGKDRVSRRKILTKFAASAVALPAVAAIVAPTALHAQSSCPATGPGGFPANMLAPGAMQQAGYNGVCDAGCPNSCAAFNFDCCSNMLVYAGTCTNSPGPLAICDCTCL
jgi:hypothetical protein